MNAPRFMVSAVMVMSVWAGFSLTAAARKKPYHRGVITRMEASDCGYNSSTGMLGTMLGAGNNGHKSKIMLCRDYTLHTDGTIYTIRPKDRHARLLPVNRTILYRIAKDKMKVKFLDGKHKKNYYVLSERPSKPSPCNG